MLGQLTGRILLVDDDPLDRKLITGHLVAAGYVVRTAFDGLDAIGKLRVGLPDLIIVDLKMPRMSGLELLYVVRKRFPQIPVIVISAVGAHEMPEGMLADAYFHKSKLRYEQLLQTTSDLARKPSLRSRHPLVDVKPVQATIDRDGQYIIQCDECLREFRPARATNLPQDEKWTICVHCGQIVRFFIDAADLPAPARQ